MKKIIRLTESDLHKIVKTAINEILGNVPNTTVPSNGNSMTGGEFGGYSISNSIDIKEKFLEELVNCTTDYDIDEEEVYNFVDILDKKGVFNINIVGDSSYDSSTGYGNRNNPVVSIHNSGIGKLKRMINTCNIGNPYLIKAALQAADNINDDISNNPEGYDIR